jgi:hypothetical protein
MVSAVTADHSSMQPMTMATPPPRPGDERGGDACARPLTDNSARPGLAFAPGALPPAGSPVDAPLPHEQHDPVPVDRDEGDAISSGDVSPRNRSIKHLLKHAAQSTRMWSNALVSSLSPRRSVAIAPSSTRWDPASNLRAWALAPALRRLGWRVLLLAPEASLAERRRVLQLWRPDVLLLQQSRHPLNRPRFYPGVACVFDQDDADYLDARVRDEIVGCCEGASLVIAGSRAVGRMLGRHNPNVEVIWTSTPAPPPAAAQRTRVAPSLREPIVAWAHSSPFDYPAELAYVQRVMTLVARVRPGTQFWLFGCRPSTAGDDGDDARVAATFAPLEAAGIRCTAWPYMPYARYLDVVARAAVGLQPVCLDDSPYSEGKSFGKVLAYLAGEVPVVASNNVDHPLFFESGRNGFLVHDEFDCAQAVVTLLGDKALRDDVAMTALQDFRMRLSTTAIAAQVSAVLLRAIGDGGGEPPGAPDEPAELMQGDGDALDGDAAPQLPQRFTSPMRASSATR